MHDNPRPKIDALRVQGTYRFCLLLFPTHYKVPQYGTVTDSTVGWWYLWRKGIFAKAVAENEDAFAALLPALVSLDQRAKKSQDR